jgi:hypothetical protein
MTRFRSEFNDTVVLKCTENNQTLEAEVLDFTPAYMLTCSVNRQVKVYLRYNKADKNYVGNVGTLEFTSQGPKETKIKQGR